MNARKQRDKNRRRASRLAQQAWDAADGNNFDLAVKIIRRAVALHPANPRLWHDQGMLLCELHADDEAARSFQTAIQTAPDFAEAYASLAALRARQGHTEQAVGLQRQAVRHAPTSQHHQNILAAYAALLADTASMAAAAPQTATHSDEARIEDRSSNTLALLADCIQNLPWPELGDSLTRRGLAHMPGLLCPEQCEALRAMFHEDRLFAKTVTMNKNRFGKGVYRYFVAPVPDEVEAIRRLVYPHAAEIANRWQRLLDEEERYPATWSAFCGLCAAAGQTTPSPLLLRYEAGGFNAPHQDIRGEVFFPLQLVIVLSPRAASLTHDSAIGDPNAFTGGEFLFCDQPERKASDRRLISAGLGDAVLFCTRARLVRVGDIYGLKPVKHGLNRVISGIRYALGIPFHEFE
jgi:hypothetical protein